MTWTTDKPKVAGWYWWRPQKFKERKYWRVEQVRSGDIERGIYDELSDEWAGPISEPQER